VGKNRDEKRGVGRPNVCLAGAAENIEPVLRVCVL
jgi:hypothetical protein